MTVKELIKKLQSFNDPDAEVVVCDLHDDTESGNYGLNDRSIAYTKGESRNGDEVMGVLICFENAHTEALA